MQTAPIRTPEEALGLLRERRLLTLTGSAGKVSLVSAVVDGPVRGSWWSHPQGALIYSLANALAESPEVTSAKLVDQRVTFIHRTLWPALVRVVTDRPWRLRAAKGLTQKARGLLEEIEASDLRLDDRAAQEKAPARRALTRAKDELVTRLLVQAEQVHTEKGRHATALRSWARWTPDAIARRAAKLGFAEALDELRLCAAGQSLAIDL